MEILIEKECAYGNLEPTAIKQLCEFAMRMIELPEHAELSVTFVSNERIAELNETFRGKSGPTDVLSFECDNLEDGFPVFMEGEGAYALGDVIIAPDVAQEQARQLGNTFEEEIALLLVHGILHLVGYDHIEDDEAKEMEMLQTQILAQWADEIREGTPS